MSRDHIPALLRVLLAELEADAGVRACDEHRFSCARAAESDHQRGETDLQATGDIRANLRLLHGKHLVCKSGINSGHAAFFPARRALDALRRTGAATAASKRYRWNPSGPGSPWRRDRRASV